MHNIFHFSGLNEDTWMLVKRYFEFIFKSIFERLQANIAVVKKQVGFFNEYYENFNIKMWILMSQMWCFNVKTYSATDFIFVVSIYCRQTLKGDG